MEGPALLLLLSVVVLLSWQIAAAVGVSSHSLTSSPPSARDSDIVHFIREAVWGGELSNSYGTNTILRHPTTLRHPTEESSNGDGGGSGIKSDSHSYARLLARKRMLELEIETDQRTMRFDQRNHRHSNIDNHPSSSSSSNRLGNVSSEVLSSSSLNGVCKVGGCCGWGHRLLRQVYRKSILKYIIID